MGILDSVLGGGSQKVETRLPGYVDIPSHDISRITTSLINNPKQRQFNTPQKNALGQIIGTAMGGNPFLAGNTNFLTGLQSSGGLTPEQSGLAGQLTSGGFVNPAFAETQRVAMGGDVGHNPYLDAEFNRAGNVVGENFQNNVLAGMDSNFAASGLLGSKAYATARGSAEDAYGRQLNDLAQQIYGGAYEGDQSRRMGALGQLGQLGQQDVANRVTGAGIYQQGIGNQFGGVEASGAVDASRYGDAERLFQAGSTIQQQPWQSVRLGSDIIGNLQHGQTTMQQNNPNMIGQAIGLGTGLVGAAGGFGQIGQGISNAWSGLQRAFGPYGMMYPNSMGSPIRGPNGMAANV